MNKINFNNGWKFVLNDGKDWSQDFANIEGALTIDLPFDFSIVQQRRADAPSGASGGFFQCGVGKYSKSFKAKRNKKYIFMCDGSFGITDVFINSNIAYTNTYGYNSFYADITEYLRYDKENEILIRVNNKAQPNARWYGGSGIYRDVFLCECDSSYIHPFGTFVKTESVFDSIAYMSVEATVISDKKAEGVVDFEVYEDSKRTPCATFSKYVILDAGENIVHSKFQIENVRLWDAETPNMYKIKTKLRASDSKDIDESYFGVRTINVDSKRGIMLNGKSVKLRGGCIHHDQGVLGAAVYQETEYRRVAKLKEAGFNSVRLSHNPQSKYLYEACDRLGMLVIDELFDYWTEGKKEDDSHSYFKDNWEKWTDLIVRKNRCHPSIIMWSTGNEIPQKTGRGGGYYIATNIANKIRSLDSTRPITHALCSLWNNKEEYELELAENYSVGADKLDCFTKRTAITADTTDIIGYNYLEYRFEKDLIRFPNRLFINTETFPINAYTTIKQLLCEPRILGDYVWTAWDYFGETGIGHVEYNEKRGDFALSYPYHIANCGDIDIIGERKPQSYYREIAWELRKAPYIAVRHPKLYNTPYFISGWGFYECEKSWCFDGYEGQKTKVYVFADCDEVALFVNGKEVGRKEKTENGVYEFDVEYQRGKITAQAIKNGKVIGTHEIESEGKKEKLSLVKEKSYIAKNAPRTESEIIYAYAYVTDNDGKICTQSNDEITYTVKGADILGVGSGELTTEEKYTSKTHRVYMGRALVVLKKHKGTKQVTLKASANGLNSAEITF